MGLEQRRFRRRDQRPRLAALRVRQRFERKQHPCRRVAVTGALIRAIGEEAGLQDLQLRDLGADCVIGLIRDERFPYRPDRNGRQRDDGPISHECRPSVGATARGDEITLGVR